MAIETFGLTIVYSILGLLVLLALIDFTINPS